MFDESGSIRPNCGASSQEWQWNACGDRCGNTRPKKGIACLKGCQRRFDVQRTALRNVHIERVVARLQGDFPV